MKNFLLLLILNLSLFLSGCTNDDDNGTRLPEELNFTGQVISCGDFFVNQLLDADNQNTVLTINGSGREDLNLTSEFRSFSLPNSDLAVSITIWDGPAAGKFCNDVIIEEPELISTWNAISGNVRILVTEIEETEFETLYSISLVLENVVFENSLSGEQTRIPALSIENAGAGWLPG